MNHDKSSAVGKASKEFARSLFARHPDREMTRLNGALVGFDEKRGEIFIKHYDKPTAWMPADKFVEQFDEVELKQMEQIPKWDGQNHYQILTRLHGVWQTAITRYRSTE